MAHQILACRVEDELTLQMLATRSGVAASTIHKVESERMVPTNSVFLKITKGLGEGSDELMRDLDNRQRRWEQTSFVKKHPLRQSRSTSGPSNWTLGIPTRS